MELKMNFNFINYFTKFIPKIKGWNLKKKYKFKELSKKTQQKIKKFKITRVIFKTNKKFYKKQMNEKKNRTKFPIE
jgi:hypothetical protein